MQKPTEHTLEKELKRFRVLYDLAIAMTADHTLDENLQVVVDKSRELLETDTAYVALRDDVQGDVYMHTLSGIQTEAFKKLRLPFGKGLGGLVAKTRRGLIVDDYFGEKTINHVVDKIVADEGVISGMAAPIQMRLKNLGVLYVFNRRKTPFSQFDLDTLTLLGNLAAVEISRQQAEETVRRGQAELEQRVKERTRELIHANTQLEQEIQERKRSEKALRESEEKYRELTDSLPQVVFETDGEGNLTFANRNAFEIFEYTRDDFDRGLSVLQMVTPEHRERALENMRRIWNGEKSGPSEYLAIRKDGSAFPVVIHSNPVFRDHKAIGLRGLLIDISKQKRTEEAFIAAEQKYRSIFENANEGIFQSTPAGSFISANPALARIYGYESPEDLIRDLTDIKTQLYVSPGRREEFIRLLQENGFVQEFESEIRRKDGSMAVTKVNARPVRDASGDLLYYEGSVEDITERKRAEDALRKSEERYRTLVEKLPIGIYRCTPGEKGEFLMANPSFLKMFGYESGEALKRVRVSDIYMDPSERKLFSDSLLAMKSGTMTDRRLKKKDGTPLWATVTARVAYEEGSEKIAYFDCAIQDITERRQAERALRESEEKYRDLFENSSDLLCFHDMQGNLLDANLAFKKGYGFSGKDILHANARDFIPERYSHEFEDYMRRVSETGRDEGFMRIAVKDGREVIVEYRNSVVRDSEGKPVGVRGSGRDVTERIKSEKERKRLQAQLMQAQRIEAVGTLAGGIAHNFNNLLMGIQGNASLARMETDPSHPIHRKLENIEKLVQSGAKLTNQLLAYAREGKYEVRSVSLNHLVRDMSSTFAEARKDIKVYDDLSENLMGVKADQGQMEQVVLNLLVNAADAMPSGGKVFVKTRNVSHEEMAGKSYKAKPGKYVLLDVSDTGVGMDKKTMERIFEPFFTTKGLGKGTGLGLASVYGIIKGHGGYIDVHSEQMKGTTFEIYLPASEKKVTKEKEIAEGIILGSETILLVDDEDIIIDVGKQMIGKLGYNVLIAGSGKEAIKVYRENLHKIDLVVLDMIMPDTGGGETYDQLKGINPGVKVLLSSGYSIDGQAKEILDRGCSGFIKKPFDMKSLSRALREILDS